MAPPKDIARSYPKRGLTADVGFRSEPKFCGDGSVYFDGSSDYAETAASSDLAVGDTFTLTAWVWLNPNPSGASKYAFRVGDTGAATPNIASISVFGGATPQFYCYSGSGSVSSSIRCDSARWYHVAAVIKPGSGTSQIFVDGIDTTNSHSLTFNVTSSSSKIRIGDWSSGGNDWEGYIANACLFTESLTEDQVRQVMRASDYASHAAISTVEAFYPLSENFNDSTGNHNATASGSPEFRPNRPQLPRGLDLTQNSAQARVYTGRAIDLDGSADYLQTTLDSALGSDFSVSLWFLKRTTTGSNNYLFSSGDAAAGAGTIISLSCTSANVIAVYDQGLFINSSLRANLNQWHHVVLTVGTGANSYTVYLDGIGESLANTASPNITNGDFEIGRYIASTVYHDGLISDVKVFDQVLTADQVKDLYHYPEQVLPTGVSASNLIHRWALSDYNDATAGGMGGRYFQDSAGSNALEDKGSSSMAFAQPVPCPQLGLQQSATRVYFERNATRAQANLGAAPGTTCTMSAWVMVDQQYAYQYFMKNGTSVTANAFFAFAIDTNRRLYAVQSSNVQAEGSLALSDYGEWNHVVAMTKSTAPYVRFFINGVEDTSITDNGMVAFNLTSTFIEIGSDGGANHLKGFLNDCAIWDVELSNPEVAALYNSGVQGMDVSTVQSSNLKGWWKCDDLTTFKDYSGNGVNATLTASVNAASFPENASGSTIVGDFSMKRKGVSVLNFFSDPSTIDSSAVIPAQASLFPSYPGGYTFSAFFRLIKRGTGAFSTIFYSTDTSVANQLGVFCNTSGIFQIDAGDGGTSSTRVRVPAVTAITDSDWHHFAVTITHGTPTTTKIYIDGALDVTDTSFTQTGAPTPSDIVIGDYPSGTNEARGPIACFRIYQVPLSDNEIEQIYRSDLRLIKGLENE